MAQETGKIGKFLSDTRRILKIAKKPSKKEYSLTMKITMVGLLITGGISYIIQLISHLIISQN